MAHFHWFRLQIEKWSKWAIFGQKVRSITLVFCRKMTKIEIHWFWLQIEKWWKWAIFGQKVANTFQSAEQMTTNMTFWPFIDFWLESNQWISSGHLSAKYQGYSLTFWPKMAHFHHFSICNQNQWSILVIFRQNTKVIALLFGQKWLIDHFSICNQNQWISILVICRQNTKVIALLFGQKWLSQGYQSAIKINEFQFGPDKYQGYTLLFEIHFHDFDCIKIDQFCVIFRQNTKVIALLFGQQWLIFITFQSGKSMNFNFGHFVGKYQGYSLTFWPKMAHFHHFSICKNQWISILSHFSAKYQGYSLGILAKNGSFSSLFNLQSKSMNFNFVICRQNTKVVPLLFWPKMAHFHHFSICNQNQWISILVIFGKIPRL